MLEQILISASVAWRNVRANPLHTGLSTLGIIIGVGALVSILSLADGLERFAREQIETTTSLHSLSIQSRTYRAVDNVRVERDDYPVIGPEEASELREVLRWAASVALRADGSGLVRGAENGREAGARYMVLEAADPLLERAELLHGSMFDELPPGRLATAIVINRALAGRLAGEARPESVLGQKLYLGDKEYTVEGIVENDPAGLTRAVVPMQSYGADELRALLPGLHVEAERVEDVPLLEQQARTWINGYYEAGEEGFLFASNRMRLEQTRQAMLVFKIVMGLITGISVLVGGIGVMNVLLVSISERTSEIGIRKATGAKKRDIVLQFLSESVTISGLGSFMGLLLGMGVSLAAVPIVKMIVDVPFQVAFLPSTFLIIGGLAIVIGIVFGTYPALRAARLTPIDAMRRE